MQYAWFVNSFELRPKEDIYTWSEPDHASGVKRSVANKSELNWMEGKESGRNEHSTESM